MSKAEEQLDMLANDLEGYLNDFDSGITSKEKTITGLIDYLLERVKTSNKYKLTAHKEKCIEKVKKIKVYNVGQEVIKEEAIEILKEQHKKLNK